MAQGADLADRIEAVLTQLTVSNFDVVMKQGQSCDYPNNLISGAHLIAQVSGDSLFVNATRQTIIAGGDSGSRNMFVGSVLGALQPSGIPQAWKDQTSGFAKLSQKASVLARRCSAAQF